MASGEIHHSYLNKAWILAIPISICFFIIGANSNDLFFILLSLFFLVNFWLTNFIDPDADLAGLSDSEGRAMRMGKRYSPIGGIFSILWVNWWMFYSFFMSYFGGHRGLSHKHILGTLTRILHFNIPFIALYFLGANWWNWNYEILYMSIWLFPYLLGQFLAWTLADEIHYVLDSQWAKGILYHQKKEKYERNNVLDGRDGKTRNTRKGNKSGTKTTHGKILQRRQGTGRKNIYKSKTSERRNGINRQYSYFVTKHCLAKSHLDN